jgi:hypothetical protein
MKYQELPKQSNVVYKLVNILTDECFYVGSTTKLLSIRFSEHLHHCTHESSRAYHFNVYEQWREFGIQNVSIQLIKAYEGLDRTELRYMESYWIQILKPGCNKNRSSILKIYKRDIKDKICKVCNQSKVVGLFGFRRRICLDCIKLYNHSYYVDNIKV